MVKASCIGFARSRDNKKLQELIKNYLFEGKGNEFSLREECKKMRIDNWKTQQAHGMDNILSNDFTMFDKMLDATCLLGNIQRRFYWEGGKIPLEIYFSIAFGTQKDKFDVLPLELQNWLDTNYLYYVPEFAEPIDFACSDNKPVVEFLEAKALGIQTASSVISPMSYLLLGKSKDPTIEPISLLEDLLPVYKELFSNYQRVGIKSIQIEDPMIFQCIESRLKERYTYCYNELRDYAGDMEVNIVPYRCNLMNNLDFICSLPVNSIHIDTIYNKNHLDDFIVRMPKTTKISLGIVDGGDIWKNNLNNSIEIAYKFCEKFGVENISVANSCPMFLIPFSLENEKNIDAKVKSKMSFAVEKLDELNIIKTAINSGKNEVKDLLEENKKFFSENTIKVQITKAEIQDKKNKKKQEESSRFDEVLKKYKLSNATMMNVSCDDEKAKQFQNNTAISFYSASCLNDDFDISNITQKLDGVITLENSLIPRNGYHYYAPNVIVEPVKNKGKDGIFDDYAKNVKNLTKKPVKFEICSPNHYFNFCYTSPFIKQDEIISSISKVFADGVSKIATNVDILQVNDLALQVSKNEENSAINTIYANCLQDSEFIATLKDAKCIIFYVAYTQIGDNIGDLCEMPIDMLYLESANSGHEILTKFITYKPSIPVCIGIFDPTNRRLPTKNEVNSSTSKILASIGANKISFGIDCSFPTWKQEAEITKALKIFCDSINEVNKAIAKNKDNEKEGGEKKTKKSGKTAKENNEKKEDKKGNKREEQGKTDKKKSTKPEKRKVKKK